MDRLKLEGYYMDKFELYSSDYEAIKLAKRIAYRFLKFDGLEARQIIGLGNALYALERMPLTTPGVFIEFGIVYRAGSESFNEMIYIGFNIFYETFEISRGGSVYNKSVGSDSFSEPGWIVELGGYREAACDLEEVESSISEYINLGATITVSDESKIDYENLE